MTRPDSLARQLQELRDIFSELAGIITDMCKEHTAHREEIATIKALVQGLEPGDLIKREVRGDLIKHQSEVGREVRGALASSQREIAEIKESLGAVWEELHDLQEELDDENP